MIDYVEEKGKDPLADVNDFHEFVKRSLHVDVNDRQVLTKARRLKKKFENNAVRVVSKGKVRSFSNPHEKKMYELSKNLWGSDANNNNNKNMVMSGGSKKAKVNVNVTPKKTNKSCKAAGSGNGNVGIEPEEVQPLRAVRGLDYFGSMGLPITDEVIMSKGLELVTGAKRVEMEAKWKNLKVQELEHFLKKVDVLKEQAEVVLNVIAKSGGK
ncbi:putative transcription factor GeBP family [Helianthus annuus]|nr:putative transcription factor GeBP family [Helianthus annuus]KAJ0733276.1 putative transcription factor GeBP family [Helianthus annuus]KAJ0873679.1 putative transcription factor GeBP family [Helianthus annuus]